jgi:hypothetical protein
LEVVPIFSLPCFVAEPFDTTSISGTCASPDSENLRHFVPTFNCRNNNIHVTPLLMALLKSLKEICKKALRKKFQNL